MQDVDEIRDGQHACGIKGGFTVYCLGGFVAMRFIGLLTHKPLRLVVPQRRSPQAVCNQCEEGLLHLGGGGQKNENNMSISVGAFTDVRVRQGLTCSVVSNTTSLQLVGMAS